MSRLWGSILRVGNESHFCGSCLTNGWVSGLGRGIESLFALIID